MRCHPVKETSCSADLAAVLGPSCAPKTVKAIADVIARHAAGYSGIPSSLHSVLKMERLGASLPCSGIYTPIMVYAQLPLTEDQGGGTERSIHAHGHVCTDVSVHVHGGCSCMWVFLHR